MKREAALSTAKSAMRVVRVGGGNPGVSRHRGRAAVGAAADVHAGRLHAIEDAVELVPAVLVGGPHGLEIVELREVAEATVGRLRHGPLSVAMPAEALGGLDPEAFRGLLGKEALRAGTRDAVTAAQDLGAAVVRIHLATGKGVEAAEEAHALLPADHVDLGGSLRAAADEEDGGGGPGRDGRGRRHGAGARERRSSASCSISASADTGLATTRSTN